MLNPVLKEQIEQLESSIKDTDDLIAEAYEASESMFEPYKTSFVNELKQREMLLDVNRGKLELLKMIIGES